MFFMPFMVSFAFVPADRVRPRQPGIIAGTKLVDDIGKIARGLDRLEDDLFGHELVAPDDTQLVASREPIEIVVGHRAVKPH